MKELNEIQGNCRSVCNVSVQTQVIETMFDLQANKREIDAYGRTLDEQARVIAESFLIRG